MVNSTRNWNTDPRFRSSGKLGSEEWASELEQASGGFRRERGMSWKSILIFLVVIVLICAAIFALSAILTDAGA